ncbi:MAG: helix-turn-helix transcriptional regulator, partial [Bacteroidetes bacterium]|nr:helix-turn-helix transcriptional regulator [Bacteroidota bacterium]
PVRMAKNEKEIFGLLGNGLSDREIGEKLNIPIRHVRTQLQTIMRKLALHTRLEIRDYKYTDGTLETIVGSISVIGE